MSTLSRRDFGKLFAAAALTPAVSFGQEEWSAVRSEFTLDEKVIVMNAANLCPATRSVNEVLFKYTRDIDANPSPQNRAKFNSGREDTRKKIAAFLNVTPDEIVLTRNTSEGNNFVSSGIELKPGDEVVIFDENHPTNNDSWKEKAKRFGFTVKPVTIPTPPESSQALVKAMSDALTARTKVLAITHVTSSFGTVFPAKELCRIARERGILTLVDGAQSFGAFDLDLKDMGCDFFTGSSHKWLMGPKEVGVLFVRSDAQAKLYPSEVGVLGGSVGASRVFERLGQRDDPAIMALGEAIDFHNRIGKKKVQAQSVALGDALKKGLMKLPGVKMYSPTAPELSCGVVTFKPGTANVQQLYAWMYQTHGIACATRGGETAGLRISPHIYNSFEQIDKVVAAVGDYMKKG
jgi:isopenicillin-N epimerase